MKEIDIRIEAPRLGYEDEIRINVNGYQGQRAIVALKSWLAGNNNKKLRLAVVCRGEIQEIELQATPQLKFRCIERIGGAVLDMAGRPLHRLQELREGQEIQCPGMAGYYRAKVKKVEGDTAYAETESGRTGLNLVHGRDERNCWVCSAVGNLEGLKKVKFT